MRPLFHPRLINEPFDDPGLFIAYQFSNRAILFDLGDLASLSARDILKITHIFVSHTHMDHFVGFDRLLRLHLGRTRALHFYGPPGFCDNVAGKLAGYTWNLVDNYTNALTLEVNEISTSEILTRSYRCEKKFCSDPGDRRRSFRGPLLEEPGITVNAAVLDHGIPCLAFALKERFHINVIKNKLEALGLTTGPWLNDFKQAIYAGANPEDRVSVPRADGGRESLFSIAELADQITLVTSGQKIAYVTDVADTPTNRRKIVALAANCDMLFIEAAFLESDAELARAKHHLTAHQAGELAAQAGAKQFTVFHFSQRYTENAQGLYAEARSAFEAGQELKRPA